MDADQPPNDVLLLMLADLLHEAEAIRPHDPSKAAHLDDMTNELRAVIAESPDSQGRGSQRGLRFEAL
jgi:hypothetical protein